MRRLSFILIMVIPYFLTAQTLSPDWVWKDGSGVTWYDGSRGGYGLATGTYNGNMYVFNFQLYKKTYQNWYPYVYRVGTSHNNGSLTPFKVGKDQLPYLTFGYEWETVPSSYAPDMWRSFTFNFNGRLWYFMQIKIYSINDSKGWGYAECFGEIPASDTGSYFSYCIQTNTDPKMMKLAAFQADSSLYFVTYNNDNSSKNWTHLCVQKYMYNSGTNKFSYVQGSDQYLNSLSGLALGGLIKKLDSKGKEYVLISFISSVPKIYKISYVKGSDGNLQFSAALACDSTFTGYMSASALINGSMKGKKTTESQRSLSNRVMMLGINLYANTDGINHLSYAEFQDNDGTLTRVHTGESSVASSAAPGILQMFGATDLVPEHYSNYLSGTNGYMQKLWFFYPDKNKYFNAEVFQSDNWMLDSHKDSVQVNQDLDKDNIYPGISGLWSLVGILDGAPPVSMNWDKWDASHNNTTTAASKLGFETVSQQTTEISNTYEDEWSLGESVDIKAGKEKISGTFSEEFKYCNTYKNTVTNSYDTITKYTKDFDMRPEHQDYGFFIYRIPQIKRFMYNLYPWWDTDTLNHRIPNTLQYLWRTFGYTTLTRQFPLDSFPFHVKNPNASPMEPVWGPAARNQLYMELFSNGVTSSLDLDWDDGSGGNGNYLSIGHDSVYTVETENSYDAHGQIGLDAGIPKIFRIKANVSGGYDVHYSTGTTSKTNFEKTVYASLEPLVDSVVGVNVAHIHTGVYLMTPEISWWFYDSLQGQRPWYIAYILNSSSKKILLSSPNDESVLDQSGLNFSWRADGGEIHGYTISISTAPYTSGGHLVYRDSIGYGTEKSPHAYIPEKGKIYYWMVRGYDNDNQAVSSHWFSFSIKNDISRDPQQNLSVLLYPNPGRGEDIRISTTSTATGPVVISLLNSSGITLGTAERENSSISNLSSVFPGIELDRGFYLIVIRSQGEQVVKKLIIF